jgi:hypothetical protein
MKLFACSYFAGAILDNEKLIRTHHSAQPFSVARPPAVAALANKNKLVRRVLLRDSPSPHCVHFNYFIFKLRIKISSLRAVKVTALSNSFTRRCWRRGSSLLLHKHYLPRTMRCVFSRGLIFCARLRIFR